MITRVLAVLVPLSLLVAACGDEDESADTTTASLPFGAVATVAETAAPATTVAAVATTAETATSMTTTTTTAAPTTSAVGTDDDCIVGSWVITQDELNALYSDISADIDGIIETSNFETNVEVSVRVGGQVIDAGDEFRAIFATSPMSSAPYDCSGPNPVILFSTGSDRIPIGLTPA